MKCSVCNGTLKYKNGLYVCENCGAIQQSSSSIENEDVFIAYVENDELGRRTKDSMIAQDVFNKLQGTGINTFYERVSASELVGDHYSNAIEAAINNAKIIIMIGSTIGNFEKIYALYQSYMHDKIIIPVYSQIKAYDLPKEISNLQAVNYDSIGAITDITNSISKKLGKAYSVDIIEDVKKKKTKGRKILSLTLGIIILVIISILLYFVFGTHYVLDSKKYEYAQKLETDGSTIEALQMYLNITNYKDSVNKIDAIYDGYNGYFYKDNNELTFYINIDKNFNSKIEVMKKYDQEHISFQTESKVKGNIIDFEFKDNLDQRGKGKIELLDDSIKLTVISNNQEDLSLGNIEYVFKLSDRKDAPKIAGISHRDLINWLNNKFTLQDIHAMGLKTEFIVDLYPVADSQNVFKISNTNYGIVISDNGENAESIVGIYVPFEEVFPETEFSYLPFVLEDNAFIHYKTYIGGATNLMYELGGIESDFLETTFFITSKDSTVGIWEEIVKSIADFNDNNKNVSYKYHLEISPDDGTDTRIGEYDNLSEAIKQVELRKNENYIVVNSLGKVIYIP